MFLSWSQTSANGGATNFFFLATYTRDVLHFGGTKIASNTVSSFLPPFLSQLWHRHVFTKSRRFSLLGSASKNIVHGNVPRRPRQRVDLLLKFLVVHFDVGERSTPTSDSFIGSQSETESASASDMVGFMIMIFVLTLFVFLFCCIPLSTANTSSGQDCATQLCRSPPRSAPSLRGVPPA